MAAGKPTINEEWITFADDGHHVYLETIKAPMYNEQNELIGVLGIGRDITDRKHTEELLRESEERLRITLEETQIGTFDWDIKKDVYYVSNTYYTMLGYKPKEGAADRDEWLDRVHPDDKEIITQKISNAINGLESKYEYEARIKHSDGSYKWIYVIGRIIKWDENKKPVRQIGVRIDITERKFAENELIAPKKKPKRATV